MADGGQPHGEEHQDVSERRKQRDRRCFFPILCIFRPQLSTTTVGPTGENHRTKQIAGVFHQDRRKREAS